MYIVVIAVVLACAPLLFHWMHNSTNVFFPTVHDLVSTVLPSSTTPTLSVAGSRPGITDDASQKSELASVSGVYVVSRILRRTADNLPDSVYESPDIDGVVISAPWNDIEPSPGVYDWTLVDTEIKRAVANGKKITSRMIRSIFHPVTGPMVSRARRTPCRHPGIARMNPSMLKSCKPTPITSKAFPERTMR